MKINSYTYSLTFTLGIISKLLFLVCNYKISQDNVQLIYIQIADLVQDDQSGFSLFWFIVFLMLAGAVVFYYFNSAELRLYQISRKEKLGLAYSTIRGLVKSGLPADKFISTLIDCRKSNIPINISEIEMLYMRKVDFRSFVRNMIKAKDPENDLSPLFLKEFYLRNDNASVFAEFAFECASLELSVTLEDIANLATVSGDLEGLIYALKYLKEAGVELDVSELLDDYFMTNKVVADIITGAYICCTSKLDVDISDLINHASINGNVIKVVEAYSKIRKTTIDVSFSDLCDVDLAGYDVVHVVKDAMEPRILKVENIKGVTKDRYPIIAQAEVTVRTRIKDIIINAKEETLINRVKESVASAVGTFETHEEFFLNPAKVSLMVIEKNIDKETCFEIISISITDIGTGQEIDAELKVLRAQYEKIILQADSERRKILAEVSAQEARVEIKRAEARIKQAEAKYREAEAKIKENAAKAKSDFESGIHSI